MKKGGEFEQLVAKMLAVMPANTVERVDPPVRVFRMITRTKGHAFEGAFSASGKLDFAGGWDRRYIEFDAKDCKGKRFPFAKIRDAQWLRMRRLLKNGDACGVLVRFRGETGNEDQIWGIHAHLLTTAADEGKKSITVDDCAARKGDLTIPVRYFKIEDLTQWFRVLTGKKV